MPDKADQLSLMLGRRPNCSPFTGQRTAKKTIMTGPLSVDPCTSMQTNVRHLAQIQPVQYRAHCIPPFAMKAPVDVSFLATYRTYMTKNVICVTHAEVDTSHSSDAEAEDTNLQDSHEKRTNNRMKINQEIKDARKKKVTSDNVQCPTVTLIFLPSFERA